MTRQDTWTESPVEKKNPQELLDDANQRHHYSDHQDPNWHERSDIDKIMEEYRRQQEEEFWANDTR